MMHALMMYYDVRVNARADARVDVRVNTHAMQFA